MKILDALKNKTKTKLAISLAKYPGKFGVKVHNALLKHYGMDIEYVACSTDNLKESIQNVRDYNIIGCGISMPFKTEVMQYLDEIDESAKNVGAVNTIVNRGGVLKGYNTDVEGAKWALQYTKGNIALLGNGGMSKAFQYNLKGVKYDLITRNFWNLLDENEYNTIINATPIGLLNDDSPVKKYNHEVAIDCVVKMTTFVKNSKFAVNGIDMSLRQACKQFELYFSEKPIIEIMRESVRELYDN